MGLFPLIFWGLLRVLFLLIFPILLRVALLALIIGAAYVAWLDLKVQRRLEVRVFDVPTRFYARPLEIYPGRRLSPDGLEAELRAVGFHRTARLVRPASYGREGNKFEIYTRGFHYPDGPEAAKRFSFRIRDGRVTALRVAAPADPERPVRVEPRVIARLSPPTGEDRRVVSLDQVPRELVGALLVVEDRGYFTHNGLSLRGLMRALFANLRAGEVVQGGSTLTQQLAKSLFLSEERTIWRKVNDVTIALLLESHFDKDELLEAYLNEIYLGQSGPRAIHGFGLAAKFYFGRELTELGVSELALLVAIAKGPSYYNPRRHPERAKTRRDLVLALMVEHGVLSPVSAERAKARNLGLKPSAPLGNMVHPDFLDLVRRQLRRDYGSYDLRTEGLRIFTTLDPLVQGKSEEVLATQIGRLAAARKQPELQGAVVVTKVPTGEVVALVGGRDASRAGFNRALDAVRPIGSLVKPAVYLAALEQGRYHLGSLVEDRAVRLKIPTRGGTWEPRNFDGEEHGDVPLYVALARSYNLATVRLGMDVGLRRVGRTLRSLGVNRPFNTYPSMLLGAVELSPLEVSQIYHTLAAGGFHTPMRAIVGVTDQRGRPVARYPLHLSNAVSPEGAYLIAQALRTAVAEGTGRGVSRYLPQWLHTAGKTGTTNGLRDSWFAGWSADHVITVWVGRDDNKPTGLTGATGALPVWARLMASLPTGAISDAIPEGVSWHWIDAATGLRTSDQCEGARAVPLRSDALPPPRHCTPAGHQLTGELDERPG